MRPEGGGQAGRWLPLHRLGGAGNGPALGEFGCFERITAPLARWWVHFWKRMSFAPLVQAVDRNLPSAAEGTGPLRPLMMFKGNLWEMDRAPLAWEARQGWHSPDQEPEGGHSLGDGKNLVPWL